MFLTKRACYNRAVTSLSSSGGVASPTATTSWLADVSIIIRYHIMLIAMVAMVVFGWLMTGKYHVELMVWVALDWFLINLLNRVTDIDEDLRNEIPGTERVARRKRVLTFGCFALMAASFVASHWFWPGLTVWRAIVQLIGLGYNYRIVPTLSGLSRFKEIYFFKNFGSSVLFVLTCFVYPLASDPSARVMGWRPARWWAIRRPGCTSDYATQTANRLTRRECWAAGLADLGCSRSTELPLGPVRPRG